MRIILHIGVHKTGTSALQAFLARNSSLLAQRGILYDRLHKQLLNHHHIVGCFAGIGDEAVGRQALKEMIETATASNMKAILISSEMLIEDICDRASFLEVFAGHEIDVIAYIRRPDEIMVSAHSELVKSSSQRWRGRVTEDPLSYDPTYIDVLSYWMEREDVYFRIAPYDRRQWPQGNLFLDFLSMLEVTDPAGFDLSTTEDHANRSLPTQLTELLRQSNSNEATPERHGEFTIALYRLWKDFPDLITPIPALTRAEAEVFFLQLQDRLPRLRPFFRQGFDESFLALPNVSG